MPIHIKEVKKKVEFLSDVKYNVPILVEEVDVGQKYLAMVVFNAHAHEASAILFAVNGSDIKFVTPQYFGAYKVVPGHYKLEIENEV